MKEIHIHIESKLTKEELDKALEYNPDTGTFTWKIWGDFMAKFPGREVATHKRKDGHLYIPFKHVFYKAEELVVLTMTGSFTEYHIHHLDNELDNNCWSNLLVIDPYIMGDEDWDGGPETGGGNKW